MEGSLSGADMSLLLVQALEAWEPVGPPRTWRPTESRLRVLQLQAAWSKAMRRWNMTPTAELWSLIMESAYRRASEELLEGYLNQHGEIVRLEEKVQCWRRLIPEAEGSYRMPFLEGQREVQLEQENIALDEEVLWGDLVDWRLRDLQEWERIHPGASPTLGLARWRE